MKHQVVTFLCLSWSGLVFAQTSAFNISQAGTMVEYRESFQMVPFAALVYGDFEPAELAMGGFDGTAVTASAEIGYEGWDGDAPYFWQETEPMGQARMDFQAETSWSSAFDGPAVWVFGGFDGNYTLASTEVFVAAEESWQPGPDMLSPRTNHRAVLLNNDEVLITGGRVFNGDLNLFEGVASGAMLHLADMTWTPFDMASPHSYHVSTYLDHAAPELFVMGGADQTGIGVETTYGSTEWLLGTETQAWPPPATTQNRQRAAGCETGTWIV